MAKKKGKQALAKYMKENISDKKLQELIKAAKQRVQLKNIMKSRLLYHKYLQRQSFQPIINPPHNQYKYKVMSLIFTAIFLIIIFMFSSLRNKIAIYLEAPTYIYVDKKNQNELVESSSSLDDALDKENDKNSQRNSQIENEKSALAVETKRLDAFAQNMFFVFLLIAILFLISYLKLISHPQTNYLMDSVQLLLAQFSILYIFVNLICILYMKSYIGQWMCYETMIGDRVSIYRKFERLFIKDIGRNYTSASQANTGEGGRRVQGLEGEEKLEYEKLKKVVKFIVLRQEFLCPTFMPMMKELVLRDDFPFARYLGKCLYKTILEVLGFRMTTIYAFIAFLISYALIRATVPETYEVLTMTLLSIFFFSFQIAFKYKTQWIFSMLSHPLKSPYEFQVAPFDAVRNPNCNLDKIIIPNYLRNNLRDVRISKTRLINSHQALFWASSSKFCFRLLHFCLVFQLAWIIILFANYTEELFSSWFKVILTGLSSFLFILNLCIVFPITTKNMAIISNVLNLILTFRSK